MKRTRFNFRALTALLIFWSFILEVVTGIVLYVVPPGRIANWTNWKLLGIDKDGWAALHTIFGYLFMIFAIIHIIYNWHPIISYIRKKLKKGKRIKTEMIFSILITLIFFIGTLYSIQPFKGIMDFGDKLKNSWSQVKNEPEIPHLELKSFNKFTDIIGVNVDKAKSLLETKGIIVSDVDEKLSDIAKKYNTSPENIYKIIKENIGSSQKKSMEIEKTKTNDVY